MNRPGMKKFKNLFIFLLVLLILGGSAAGGIYAYQQYQQENTEIEVVSVANLNSGFFGDDMTSSGYVSDDSSQSVYTEDKTVVEVKVAEGDEVNIGDPLLVYDTTDIALQKDMAELELQGINNDITLAKREIERLKKITPTPEKKTTNTPKPSQSSQTTKKKNDSVVIVQVQKKDGKAYNYIDATAKPYKGKGTVDKPYRFLCTPECYVTGDYLNRLVSKEETAAFEIWSGNSTTEGTLISCWTFNGAEQRSVNTDSKWLVSTHEEIDEELDTEEEVEETETESESETESTEETYTAEELKKEIAEKESELKELEISQKKAELDIEKLKKDEEKATVLASINGVVRTVEDPEDPPIDGSPFLEVAGSMGMYIRGEISELLLDQIEIGQQITADSWGNGQTYTAVITEISEYPIENRGGYYGEGNPNVSYYTFLAYVEESEGLTNGDNLELRMSTADVQEETDALYIEKAYVRQENGQSYVLKAGKDNRLVKQYVLTGRTVYGSSIEIKSGLSESDRIAFPYGKTAKEGVKVVDSDE